MALRAVPQLGLDEQVIDDKAIEDALETREKRKAALGAVRKDFQEAHDAAIAKVAELELPEGGAARVGRFRITRSSVAARSVAFDTAPTSRIRITVATDD